MSPQCEYFWHHRCTLELPLETPSPRRRELGPGLLLLFRMGILPSAATGNRDIKSALDSRIVPNPFPLHKAARENDLIVVTLLLADRYNPNDRDARGESPLHIVARNIRRKLDDESTLTGKRQYLDTAYEILLNSLIMELSSIWKTVKVDAQVLVKSEQLSEYMAKLALQYKLYTAHCQNTIPVLQVF